MVTLAALCAISTGAIAADTTIPVKAASETSIRIHIPGQDSVSLSPSEGSEELSWSQCTPFPQFPWEIRC